MHMKLRTTALAAMAMTVVGTAALAAEACACCKEGEKMECCDKMKKAPGKPSAPEHQHEH